MQLETAQYRTKPIKFLMLSGANPKSSTSIGRLFDRSSASVAEFALFRSSSLGPWLSGGKNREC